MHDIHGQRHIHLCNDLTRLRELSIVVITNMDNDVETLGARISSSRKNAGFMQLAPFARKIGKAYNEVWRYEQDRVAPKAETLALIAETTGVSLFWLVTGREKPNPLAPDAA